MAKIELNNVGKRFPDGTVAVRDANFTIEDGEFFILVGPSGCGKSTLLNMIVGLEEVSEGEVKVDGNVINDFDPKDRNMAMVFQSYALYPHMSVRENIAFPLKMAKVPKPEIKQRVEEAAEILELTHLLDSKPRNLSGGQRQRVAMGRTIVRNPVAFLLDEPLSNLDARLRTQMRTEIARLQKRLGTTTIYVTHDQTEAMTLGDRVAVLKQGVIQQIGTPLELYERPRNLFVAAFIGSPAMNFLPALVKHGRLYFPLLDTETAVPEQVRIPQDTQYVIAGIRPEHLRVYAQDEPRSENRPLFDIAVDVVEWLGADSLVYFQKTIHLEGSEWPDMPALAQDLEIKKTQGEALDLVARLEAGHAVNEDDRVRLGFDSQRIHLFDPQSGDCITSA
jgi:multiple sugar transport system ATP-binding protein